MATTTVRLWLERHHIVSEHSSRRRRRRVVMLSALAAMAFGAVITLVFTGTSQPASPGARPSDAAHSTPALQQAALYQQQAAKWVARQLSPGVVVSCNLAMCDEVEQSGFPSGQLMVLTQTAPDPLGANVIVATPAIQSQFGTRLASVYAPQVIARFGSGPDEVDVRYLVPGGTAAFDAQQASDRQSRIAAGIQLAGNQNVHGNPATRAELLAGQVDPYLLTTLAQLAHKTTVQLVAFTDSSPGEGYAVPLRGAEIVAATPGALSAIRAEFASQQGAFAPISTVTAKNASGQQVVTVTYGAPSPMVIPGGGG